MKGCCGKPCAGAPNHDQYPSAPKTQNLLGVPPREKFVSHPQPKFRYGYPPRGEDMLGGGFMLVASLRG